MIITLCGSAKFESAFHSWNKRLTLDGHTVFSLACFPSIEGRKDWYTAKQKLLLDGAHKRKILASDAIFVIDQQHRSGLTYIGESTKLEIEFAIQQCKRIYYASKCCYENGCDPTARLLTIGPCALCYE